MLDALYTVNWFAHSHVRALLIRDKRREAALRFITQQDIQLL